MRSRTSLRDNASLSVSETNVSDLNRDVLPHAPSAGNFRTFIFSEESGLLALLCRDARPVRRKYGLPYSDLLHQEAGVLFAMANLYLLSQGLGLSYLSSLGAIRYPSGAYWYGRLFTVKSRVRL